MTISSNIKQLSKDILFYGLAITLQNSVGFILLPIYTRVLSTSEYGNQDIISVTIKIFSAILILGMDAATSRYYFDAKTKEEKEIVQSTWLWFAAMVVIPMTALLFVFAGPISKFLFLDSTLVTYFQMAVIAIPFSMLANVFVLDLRLTFRSKIFSLVTGLSALSQGVAAIVFVLVLKWGILGVFLAALIGSIIQMTVSLALTYRHFHLKISSIVLKRMLSFGLPLVPASISLWVLNSSNRYFLLSSGTLQDIALIGAANKVVIVVTFLISAFQTAWGPFALSIINSEKIAKETYAKVLGYFLLATLTPAAILSIFGRETIRLLATPRYELASPIIPLLCFGAICWGAGYILGIGTSIAKKSYHTTIATLIGAAINIGLNFLLIPGMGIIGAAVAILVGNLASMFYRNFSSQRYYPILYNTRHLFSIVTITGLASFTGILVDRWYTDWNAWSIAIKISLCILLLGFLYGFRIIRRSEIDSFSQIVKRIAQTAISGYNQSTVDPVNGLNKE